MLTMLMMKVPCFTSIHLFTAPQDYAALNTTLTLREGADGSLSRNAACAGVFIFDDPYPEYTESLSLRIRSPNTNVVRIMEGREQKLVFIIDNDGGYTHTHVYAKENRRC